MSNKPSKSDIADKAAPYLTGYIGEVVDIDVFAQSADPHIDIDGVEELLRYRFLRTGVQPETDPTDRSDLREYEHRAATTDANGVPIGVMDFVALLPQRLRSLDATITQDLQILDGEIRGRVDWQETIKHRHSTGNPDSQLFACRIQEQTVLSSRNRVLLKLLGEIQRVYTEFDESIVGDGDRPGWFLEWGSDGLTRRRLESALGNVHFADVDRDSISVTNHELTTVRSDREPLYREAAALLSYYRRLMNGALTTEQKQQLFNMDVFTPDENNEGADIFELYWIFKLIDSFDDASLQPLSSINDEFIAGWQTDDAEYRMYNDWNGRSETSGTTGPTELLDMHPPDRSDIDPDAVRADPDLARPGFIQREHESIRRQTLGEGTGRRTPDIVLLKLDPTTEPPTLERTFIGEVKHSTSSDRLDAGAQQLLEYASYATPGADIQLGYEGDSLTENASPLNSDRVELGLFVGHTDAIDGTGPPGIQIYGWEQDPDPPFDT